MYNIDAGDLGARIGFVFAAGLFLVQHASYATVPDLRGLASPEIQ